MPLCKRIKNIGMGKFSKRVLYIAYTHNVRDKPLQRHSFGMYVLLLVHIEFNFALKKQWEKILSCWLLCIILIVYLLVHQ